MTTGVRWRRRAGTLALGMFLAGWLVACTAAPQPSPTPPPPTPTVPARPVPARLGAAVPFAVAPLRGTLTTPDDARRPSLAAKIDNHEQARPQLALNRSDLAFEELVEGGLTRYAIVWQSELPEQIGPVRSIRPMDPDILSPLGGIVAYSGGQEAFVAMMQATPLVNLVFDYDDSGLFERADDRPGPHDVILAATTAVERNSELAPPPLQFRYGNADPLAAPRYSSSSASRLDLVFSEARFPSWEWDAGARVWLRSQEGGPDVDDSGERVRAVNVVALRVAIDWSYGEVPRTVLVGGGEAWAAVAGRAAHGTWSKGSQGEPIRLVGDDGEALELAPGNTWIELVPDTGSVTIVP